MAGGLAGGTPTGHNPDAWTRGRGGIAMPKPLPRSPAPASAAPLRQTSSLASPSPMTPQVPQAPQQKGPQWGPQVGLIPSNQTAPLAPTPTVTPEPSQDSAPAVAQAAAQERAPGVGWAEMSAPGALAGKLGSRNVPQSQYALMQAMQQRGRVF